MLGRFYTWQLVILSEREGSLTIFLWTHSSQEITGDGKPASPAAWAAFRMTKLVERDRLGRFGQNFDENEDR